MPVYPGLGLSLWRPFQIGIDRTSDHYFYPAGHFCPTGHLNDYCGSQSDLLLVREVAMMHVMDKLTDKVDWHEKVFDDKIVAKWRVEALAYPDEVLWTLAVTSRDFNVSSPLTGIMSEKAFDYVCMN
jgi:hypothetical protein